MTHDVRYAPPQAMVEDAAGDRRGERPQNVATAMKLLWASMALGIPSAVQALVESPTWSLAAVMLLVTALGILLYLKIAGGRNWARIVLTALVALNFVALSAPGEPRLFVLQFLDFSTQALDVVALWMLFSREAAAWFRAPA